MGRFAERFKLLRIRSHLTQDEVAKQLNISKSAISMYENGNREPDYETLGIIADFFGVDPNFLLGKHVPAYPNGDQTSGQQKGYYIDPEVAVKAQEIYEDPELRILMDAARDLSKEDLDAVLNIVKALKAKDGK